MRDDDLFDDEPWREHRGELIERVVKRGRALQFRRRVVMSVLALVFLAGPLALAASSRATGHVSVYGFDFGGDGASQTTTTTIASTTSTTAPAATKPPRGHGGKGTKGTEIPPATVPTTVPQPCVNSRDSACGAFRWTAPRPGSNPIPLSVTQATAGTSLTLTVNVVPGVVVDVDYGDGTTDRNGTPLPPMTGAECTDPTTNVAIQGYGPWTPPSSTPTTLTFNHPYGAAGTYGVIVHAYESVYCSSPRWWDDFTTTLLVTADPSATTTTTTDTTPTTLPAG